MYLTKITFGQLRNPIVSKEEAEETAIEYLSALVKTGQTDMDFFFSWQQGKLVGYTHIARPGALQQRYHSVWGKKLLAEVTTHFGREPSHSIIDDSVPKRFPSWKSASALYLHAEMFSEHPPICRMDDGESVPAHLIPLSDQQREELFFWAMHYREHDDIWIASGELEMPAYKQLAEPKSELSAEGRKLCQTIEEATGKPTYYYLTRYYGRREGETTRRCPGCGKKWHVQKSRDGTPTPFHKFGFRCEPCRLVSHTAVDFQDQRHARIGEYREPPKRKRPH